MALLGNLHLKIRVQATSCSCGLPCDSEEDPWLPTLRQIAVFNKAASRRPCEAREPGRHSGCTRSAGSWLGLGLGWKPWKPWKPKYGNHTKTNGNHGNQRNWRKRKDLFFSHHCTVSMVSVCFCVVSILWFPRFPRFPSAGDLGRCARPGRAQ